MNKIEEILAKSPDERTEDDVQYLDAHYDELTNEQMEQLEAEVNELEDEVFIATFKSMKAKREDNDSPLKKEIGKTVIKNVIAEVKDLGDGMMEAVISSEIEDRHGTVIEMKGLDVKNYMKNPVISYLHNWDVPSIGRTHKLTKRKDGKLIAKFEWAIKNDLKHIHDKARLMYELYKEKFQFAFSIEFIPTEVEGNRYTKSELVGFAPVVVPANPDALLLAQKKGLDKEYSKVYNKTNMNRLQEILEKAAKDINTLTLGDIAYLKANKEKLTGEQVKSLAAVLGETEEPKKEAKGEDQTANAIKDLTASIKAIQDDVTAIKSAEPVARKDISGQHEQSAAFIQRTKTFGNTAVSKSMLDSEGNPTKEVKLLHYVRGLQNKNMNSYLDVVGKDAMNTSDDSVILPPAEFILEIERLEEEYGVAEKDATVRRSNVGNGLKYVLGDDDLEIFDTAESGAKKSTALSYQQVLLGWRKFAGILPITDELTEDAAFDLWNDAVQRFARAYAQRADQLVFTEEATTGNTKDGILQVSGTNAVTLTGTAFTGITYDNLVDMIYGVPSPSARQGKFYLNRTIIPVIMKLKDENDQPLWLPSIRDGAPATILGRPYVETEVLPDITDTAAATPFMVYGNLKYATLGMRTDLQLKLFDSGTVGDPEEEDQDANTMNLLTQDMQALRAVKRMNAVVRFPAAFSVLKTASGS